MRVDEATIVQILIIFLWPFLATFIYQKTKRYKILSPVVLCYAGGILLANFYSSFLSKDVSISISEITIPLAIVLVVFSLNIKTWLNCAGKATLSFFLSVISGLFSALLAFYLFRSLHTESWKMAAMSVGVYTGGTPNMSAIGMSLGVENEVFILMNAADVVLGGIYLLFLMTIAHPLMSKILPTYQADKCNTQAVSKESVEFKDRPVSARVKYIFASIVLSIVCVAAGVGISLLLHGKITAVPVIITITTLAVLASFYQPVRTLPGTFEVGEYFLLVFCVAIGTLVNLQDLVVESGVIFYFLSFVMVGTIFLHYLLAIVFRIDADTLIITSVASIFGPAFVPPIARVINNRQIVITGLTTGILGYAIANYLGLAMAYVIEP